MTTPPPSDDNDVLLGEYALGVLASDARARVLQQARDNPLIAAELARWEQRLAPLTEDIEPVTPAAEVWQRIRHELGFDTSPASSRSSGASMSNGFWDNARFWRWFGLGTGTGLVALSAMVVTTLVQYRSADQRGLAGWIEHTYRPASPAPGYQVASLAQTSGATVWTATFDTAQSRLIVVPAGESHIAADRAAELWLLPLQGKPVALGLLTDRGPVVLTLPDAVMQALAAKSSLAVSVEPAGGSPTGQPTGPILAQGAVRRS